MENSLLCKTVLHTPGHLVSTTQGHLMSVSPLSSFDTLKYPLFSSVQLLSCVRLFATPWTAACKASLSITNSRSLLKLMSIVLVIPSNHLILCHPLLLPHSICPASGSFSMSQFFASGGQSIGLSASESVLSALISFRMDWLDLLAVQGTLKSLFQSTV